jgi:acyl dehydratase
MKIDPKILKSWPFPEIEQTYSWRDSILYALGVGLSADPSNLEEMQFTYEQGLKALPTMCVTLGTPGFWIKDPKTGITWQKVLHGEQGLMLHKPIPAEADIVAINRVQDVVDKGEGRGALIYVEREISEKASGQKLASLTSTYFCRTDGGFGGGGEPRPKPPAVPDRKADAVCDIPIDKRAGLIYRLSGDYNPIHADPRAAEAGGFSAPIFHGLGSLGVAGFSILKTVCGYNPEKLKSMSLRFTAPVMPGETLRTEIWRSDSGVRFRSSIVERDVVALDSGTCTIDGGWEA